MFALREYQSSAIERIRELFREGKRRILLVSMMGSGKTATASHMIAGAVEKGKDVLFIAHRREILFQTREKLEAAGIEHGWIMSGMRKSAMAPVHLASIQTLTRREYPNVGLVILDEAHHCPSASYRKVMEHYQGVPQIGLTATPCRADGNGLGGLFDGMVQAAYPSELIKQGYLVPARIFAPSMPDLRGVKIKRGDYDEKQLGEAVDKPKLVGDVVSHWEQHAQGRKTIVFAVTRAHAQHLVENFQNCGHRALYVDGETNHYQRKEIFGEFGTQRNGVLVNVGITTEGYDNPAVSCIVLARPTKSLGLYLQMSGRGLRPAEGKKELLILDHSGASLTHGYPDEDIVWNLDPTQPAGTKKPKEKDKRESKPWVCGYCFCVNHDSVDPHCVSCGQKAVKAAHSPEVRKADLQELQRKTKAHTSTADREKEWVKFVFICSNSNRKIGAAYHMYKQKFGCNPHHGFQYSPRGAVEWNMPAREFIDRWKSKHRHEDREAELERQAIMEEGHIT